MGVSQVLVTHGVARNLHPTTPVPLLRVSCRALGLVLATCLTSMATAEPVAIDDVEEATAAPAWIAPGESPIDVEAWVREESTRSLLAQAAEATRHEVLQHGLQARPPTWIQAAATAAAGSVADDAVERAERDLQTLNWVIEQQQRDAAARREGRASTGGDGGDDERWFRQLLPRHWIPILKAHREWVIAGGTTVLLLVWGASMFARRPSSGPRQVEAAPATVPTKPRRHRHRRRSSLQWQ